MAMVRILEGLNECPWLKPVLQIHDELVINTYPDEKETVEKLLVENMESAYDKKERRGT